MEKLYMVSERDWELAGSDHEFLTAQFTLKWRRKWQPTPVFLPGESHRQRNLVSCVPWACQESDMTEQLTHTQGKPLDHSGMI